jgi:DNA-binding transcriptional MerR regulator/predicted RNase H-like HicB family nuclease
MPQLFATRSVGRLTGATLRQLDYWAKTGLLKPSGRDGRGRGSRRMYTFLDVVALAAVRELRDKGCPLQKIRSAVRHIRKYDPTGTDSTNLARLTLLTDGTRVYVSSDEHQVMDVVSRQHVWGIALGVLIRDTRAKVEALPMDWVEEVKVAGQVYHLRVTRDEEAGGFVVQCTELPGALEQGDTPEEAVANGRLAVESVLSFLKRRGHAGRGGHVRVG